MKGFLRILSRATMVLSLMLLLATIGLWIRSYSVGDLFTYTARHGSDLFLGVSRGKIAFSKGGRYIFDPYCEGLWHGHAVPQDLDPGRTASTRTYFRCLGFGRLVEEYPNFGLSTGTGSLGSWQSRTYFVPFWAIAGMFALLPGAWLFLAKTATQSGHCPCCRYDLRATPHRCPECGQVFEAKA